MPQAVAMERRNVMESRSRPKWRAISACPKGLSPPATGGIFRIPLCNNNVWHLTTSSCAKRNTPQGVAMERRNEMESRSRPTWRAISACPRGLSPPATGGIFRIPLCNNNVWHSTTPSCAKRNTPQGVAIESRNVMEPRSSAK